MSPVVLHHGMFGFSDIGVGKLKLTYFNGIDRAIAARGHPLIVSRVHPTSSIELRARQLRAQILLQLKAMNQPKQRVVIIAHSMGGLDARYMISKLKMADRVAALITVAAPHRGSPYADWCLQNIGKRMGGLKLMKLLRLDVQALTDLTTESCERFNDRIADAPHVKYFSISGVRSWHQVAPIFYHAHKIVHDIEGPNDGLVSVRSATWGEHLGTWRCDHLHMINRRMMPEIRNRTGNVTGRYLDLLDRLRAVGCIHGRAVEIKR